MQANFEIKKTMYIKDNNEKLKKVKITGKLMPEIKTNVAQPKNINNVCPISGCIISKRQAGTMAIKVSKYLKYTLKFFSLHKIVAIKIIINGLANSIG